MFKYMDKFTSKILFVLASLAILSASAAHAQTSLLRYMVINPPYPAASTIPSTPPQLFNLPGYGAVRVTFQNISPDKYVSQIQPAVQNKSAGFFNWNAADDINVLASSGNLSYTVTFGFVQRSSAGAITPPDPKKLVLTIANLGAVPSTTATVSQAGHLAGELQYSPATGGLFTSPTVLDVSGTILSSGYSFGSTPPTDDRNTGWALFQTTNPLKPVSRVPTLTVKFNQPRGDGIGFTLGYADKTIDPCCPPWNGDGLLSQVQLSQTGNLTGNISYSFLNSQPAGQLGFTQMRSYIDYLHSMNSSIQNIVLEWRISDCGPSGPGTSPAPFANCTPTAPDVYTEWSCSSVNNNGLPPGCSGLNNTGILGGGGKLTNFFPNPLSPSGGLPVNRWYAITTHIFLNDDIRFWDPTCDDALVTSTVFAADPVIAAAMGNTAAPGLSGQTASPGVMGMALTRAPGNIALMTAPKTSTSQIAVHVMNPGEGTGQIMMLPFARPGQ
jgi:hypothetical protein